MSREAFEKWYDKGDSYDWTIAKEAQWLAWQACAEEKDKRIAELEEVIDEQKGAIRGLNMCIGGEDSATTENLVYCTRHLDDEKCLIEVIAELTAQNKELVEALDVLISRIKLFDNPSDCGISQHDDSVTSAETLIAKVRGE